MSKFALNWPIIVPIAMNHTIVPQRVPFLWICAIKGMDLGQNFVPVRVGFGNFVPLRTVLLLWSYTCTCSGRFGLSSCTCVVDLFLTGNGYAAYFIQNFVIKPLVRKTGTDKILSPGLPGYLLYPKMIKYG